MVGELTPASDRELGDGLQPDQGIGGDQRLRRPAFAGGHGVDAIGDQFDNACLHHYAPQQKGPVGPASGLSREYRENPFDKPEEAV